MSYDTLEQARQDWEGNPKDAAYVHETDDAADTTLVVHEHGNDEYSLFRYWKNLHGGWVVSKDRNHAPLQELLRNFTALIGAADLIGAAEQLREANDNTDERED